MSHTIITKTPRAVGVVPNLNFELAFFITELLIFIHTAIITLSFSPTNMKDTPSRVFGVTVVCTSSSMKCHSAPPLPLSLPLPALGIARCQLSDKRS